MKRTNYLLGIVFSVLIAISFTSCTEDPITPVDNDPPLVSLVSGVDYISTNAQVDPNANVTVKVKASVGTGDLKLLTIYENGDKLDLERINGGINGNPALLIGDDALGFEKEIIFAVLGSKSDLLEENGIEGAYKGMTFGYQAGIGFELGALLLDVKYEGSLSQFGESITIGGEEFKFDQRLSQVIFSLGFLF